MVIKDTNNKENSLYHYALRWARADETNFPYSDFIQSLNLALNKITSIILRHDRGWKWSDRNGANELIKRLDLDSGVNKYTLDVSWLKITRVRILLDDGTTWKTLEKKERQELTDDDLSGGSVNYWYLLGRNLYFAGTPNYSQPQGIEVQFQNGPTYLLSDGSSDAKTVGYNPLFEELAAFMPALDYLQINGHEKQAKIIEGKIGIEPRMGVEGTGLLNALAVSYQERSDTPQSISLSDNHAPARSLL